MKETLKELFEDFFCERKYVTGLSSETLQNYRYLFGGFDKFYPSIRVNDICANTVPDFFLYLQNRGRLKKSVSFNKTAINTYRYFITLNCFFKWLLLHNHLTFNPFEKMKCPKTIPSSVTYLKKEVILSIIHTLYKRNFSAFILKRHLAMFYLLMYCGLRRSELLNLAISDINFESCQLTVKGLTSKSRFTREIPLHHSVILHLKNYLEERKKYNSPYLMISLQQNDKISRAGFRSIMHDMQEYTGLRFTAHQFRHTFAVNFLLVSNNITKLQQLLGHRDIETTIKYAKKIPTYHMLEDINNMDWERFV